MVVPFQFKPTRGKHSFWDTLLTCHQGTGRHDPKIYDLLQYHVIEFDILILSFFADISGVPIVDDIVDAGEDVVDVVTDGTGLVGDALSDAYNEAADKVRMRNSPVWDGVLGVISFHG